MATQTIRVSSADYSPKDLGFSKQSVPYSKLEFWVNGKRHIVKEANPRSTLLEYLRDTAYLKGAKLACGTGGCGACTVVVTRMVEVPQHPSTSLPLPHNEQKSNATPPPTLKQRDRTINACITPLCHIDGAHIMTVEGIGDNVHPHLIQSRLAELHGTQCGFCTPGFVMSLFATLANKPNATQGELEASVAGNLCRCTGYRPILDAAKTLCSNNSNNNNNTATTEAEDPTTSTASTASTARNIEQWRAAVMQASASGVTESTTTGDKLKTYPGLPLGNACIALSPQAMSALTASAIATTHTTPRVLHVLGQQSKFEEHTEWIRPITLQKLTELVAAYPDAVVVGGETDFDYATHSRRAVFIDRTAVPELNVIQVDVNCENAADMVRLGSSVSVTRALEALDAVLLSMHQQRVHSQNILKNASRQQRCIALRNALITLGTPQNRNSMSVCSHLNAGDLAPLLAACSATVTTVDLSGVEVCTPFDPVTFSWHGADNRAKRKGRVIKFLSIPPPQLADGVECEFVCSLKSAPRSIGVFGTVVAGLRLRVRATATSWEITDTSFSFSGCRHAGRGLLLTARNAAAALTAVTATFQCDDETFQSAAAGLREDISNASTSDGNGTPTVQKSKYQPPGLAPPREELRQTLAVSLLFRFTVAAAEFLEQICALSASSSTASTASLPLPPPLDARDRSATFAMRSMRGGCADRLGCGSDLFGPLTAEPTEPTEPTQHASVSSISTGAQAFTRTKGFIQTAMHEQRDASGMVVAADLNTVHGPHTNNKNSSRFPVGEPLKHACANQQATGEAIFVADVEKPHGCLEAAMVVSLHAHARILAIDPTAALALDGVHGYFDHQDLASRSLKHKAPIRVEDNKDRVFADGLVTCVGMAIGIIVAETAALARRAALLVDVTYEVLLPCLSIQEAKEQNRYHPYDHCVASGNVELALASSPHTLQGGLCVGAQEHFYMEPHAILCVPGETYGEMEVISMTQCVTKSAKCVAGCLGVPENKVRCVVKRIGGGFGGKETLSIYRAGAIAVAAAKTKRAVRLVIDRDEDMSISGQSHPFEGKWTVGFDGTGKLLAADVQLTNDAGQSICCSNVVMDRGVAHWVNAYHFGAVRVTGKLAHTHLPGNTAFRGFGVPQSALICEDMLEAVAASLGHSNADAVRKINLMPATGSHTPYGQLVEPCHAPRVVSELSASSDLVRRRLAIAAFNAKHKWRKRGLALIPTCYGVNFPLRYLNQASAQVLVYTDGTVLLTHSAVEMGQGVNIKMIQVAAQVFGIAADAVHIAECASDRCINTSPTAASVGADLNGMATLHGCEQILERLAPLYQEFPDATFADICKKAYKRQISLASTGFYASPYGGVHDWRSCADAVEGAVRSLDSNVSRGDIFNYFAFGAACAEVELDVLTGLFVVVRADILMDVGHSLNPAIDIGQVEGAFVQGMGRWTMEEICFSSTGAMTTSNPHTYYIPTSADVPRDMRITLLGDAPSPTAVHSSKAVGEPPFFLSSCVFFALKEAIHAARKDNGLTGHFRVDAPATSHRIRMACRDGKVLP